MPWYLIGGVFCLIANVFICELRSAAITLVRHTNNKIALLNSTTSPPYIYGFEALIGLGAGGSVQAGYAVIQTVVSGADLGYAVSFMMIGMNFPSAQRTEITLIPARIGGIALGLACASAVFINGATDSLRVLLPGLSDTGLQSAISGTGGRFLETLGEKSKRQ